MSDSCYHPIPECIDLTDEEQQRVSHEHATIENHALRRRTRISIDVIDAKATVRTRKGCAFVDISLALQTTKSCDTRACESIHPINASAEVSARQTRTFVDIRLTKQSAVSGTALTRQRIQCIEAGTTIHAWIGTAFVNISLTRLTTPARTTRTLKSILPVWIQGTCNDRSDRDTRTARHPHPDATYHQISAGTTILTRNTGALINISLADRTRITGTAQTTEGIDPVYTRIGSGLHARCGCAFVDVCFAFKTRVSGKTLAVESVLEIGTRTTQLARIRRTLIDIGFTATTKPNGGSSQV